jgi:hypothetical protein
MTVIQAPPARLVSRLADLCDDEVGAGVDLVLESLEVERQALLRRWQVGRVPALGVHLRVPRHRHAEVVTVLLPVFPGDEYTVTYQCTSTLIQATRVTPWKGEREKVPRKECSQRQALVSATRQRD